jgi:DNA (cytosine-5)-methyltransferase 1
MLNPANMVEMMLRVLDLFSGIGGFSLGLERTGGFQTVAFCEIEPYCRRVLAKHWPEVPIYDDVRSLTADRLVRDGIGVDVICGGFPCQDISVANTTEALGLDGTRSGLWVEYLRIIRQLRPRYIIVENVAALLNRGLERVLGGLAEIGYDAEWHCIPAAAIGAPHRRDRLWIVAYPSSSGREGLEPLHGILERQIEALAVNGDNFADARRALAGDLGNIRNDHGISVQMERNRLHQVGNSVVPQIPEMIGNAILAADSTWDGT